MCKIKREQNMKNTNIQALFLLVTMFFLVNLQAYAFNNVTASEQNDINESDWKEVPTDASYEQKLEEDSNFKEASENIEDFDSNSVKEESSDFKEPSSKNNDKDDEIWDPFETVNRGIFWFNDKADTYFIGPVARGYDYIMPEFAQTGVRNFFSNLTFPVNLVSDLIRFDFSNMGTHTSRFLINTVLGIGGLFDVATEMGIDDVSTDLGLALNDCGVPAGPYIVLPFLGASNLRDGLSMGAGTYLSPFAIAHYSGVRAGITDKAEWGGDVLDGVQTRADGEEALKSAKEASVDYYLFMQSAYYQYREGKLKKLRGEINDDNLPDEDNEDEWDF